MFSFGWSVFDEVSCREYLQPRNIGLQNINTRRISMIEKYTFPTDMCQFGLGFPAYNSSCPIHQDRSNVKLFTNLRCTFLGTLPERAWEIAMESYIAFAVLERTNLFNWSFHSNPF